MIYLIGGAPRAGKSILAHRLSAKLGIGWISTDLLVDQLRLKNVEGVPMVWNASREAVAANAEWYFPSLQRFVWGVESMADGYIIEGVDFLPEQAARLAAEHTLRSVFIGCSHMTLAHFDQFPGRSRGYSRLPEEMRRQFARDVPLWSAFIQQECARFGMSYIDTADDFFARLYEAEKVLTDSL